MNDYSPILHRLEAEDAAKHERVRQMLFNMGRPELVAELDAKIRDIRGIMAQIPVPKICRPGERSPLNGEIG